MEKFIRTLINDRSMINLDRPKEVERWTEILGVTEDELRTSVAVVGPSASAVRAHLRSITRKLKNNVIAGTPVSEDRGAIRVAYLLDRARRLDVERQSITKELTELMPKLMRAVSSGRLHLEYAPNDSAKVELLAFDHPQYLECLLYWSVKFETTPPLLLTAVARFDSRPSTEDLSEMLKTLDADRSASDYSDQRPLDDSMDENALPDGIYKIIFSADSRLVGEGVCISRDDRFVGANFGYSVSGTASMAGSSFVMIAHFVRREGHESRLNFPKSFVLTLTGTRRNLGFDGSAVVPHTEITIDILGRRVSS